MCWSSRSSRDYLQTKDKWSYGYSPKKHQTFFLVWKDTSMTLFPNYLNIASKSYDMFIVQPYSFVYFITYVQYCTFMQCSGELDDSSLTLHSKSPRRGWDTILGLPFSRPTHSITELRRTRNLSNDALLNYAAPYRATLYSTELIWILSSYSASYRATLCSTDSLSYSAFYCKLNCILQSYFSSYWAILHPTELLCILLSNSAYYWPSLHPSKLLHTLPCSARCILH